MKSGLLAGLLWGLDTVILGVALVMSPFAEITGVKEAVLLAPLVSTFFHDFCSSLWLLLYLGVRRKLGDFARAVRTKSGRAVALGALLGGPVGMSGYVAAIKFMGPAYTSIMSAFYPALGALFAYVFLKEKMGKVQILGLGVSIGCVAIIGFTGGGEKPENFALGMVCALVCVLGWALEAVICAVGMKSGEVDNETALGIRQLTSALTYGAVILPVVGGWRFVAETGAVASKASLVIVGAAICGTASYLFYYRAIKKIGAGKAMALNITYSGWAVLFGVLLLGEVPLAKNVILGIILIFSSLVAANGIALGKKKDYNKDDC